MADFKQQLKAQREQEAKERLEKRMARESADERVSMRPQPRNRKEKEEEEPAVDIRDLDLMPGTRLKLTRIVSELAEINSAMAGLNKRKKKLQEDAKALVSPLGKVKFMVDGVPASHYQTTRSTVIAELLMQAKVPIATIKACTQVTKPWSFKVTPMGVDETDYDLD